MMADQHFEDDEDAEWIATMSAMIEGDVEVDENDSEESEAARP